MCERDDTWAIAEFMAAHPGTDPKDLIPEIIMKWPDVTVPQIESAAQLAARAANEQGLAETPAPES